MNAGEVVWNLDINDSKFKSKLRSSASDMKNSASDTEKHVSNSWLKTGAVAGVVAGATSAVFQKAFSIISNSVDDAIARVDILNNFPRIMTNMGIGASESADVIKDLALKLQGLPTSLSDAALSVQRLTTATGDITKSKDIFLAFNNAVLAGGAPMQLQASALEQFSQSVSQNRVDMMAWRSIVTAMPAQLMQVASFMNLASADELGAGLRDGSISIESFNQALIKLNTEGTGEFLSFEQQAKNSTSGIQTGIANMQTAVTRGLASIMNAIGQENIANALKAIGEAFEDITGFVIKLGQFVIDNKMIFLPLALGVLAFVAPIKTIIGLLAFLQIKFDWIGWIAEKITPAWELFSEVFTDILLPAIKNLANTFMSTLLPSLMNLWEAVKKLWDSLNPGLMEAIKIIAIVIGGLWLAQILIMIAIFEVVIWVISQVIDSIVRWIDFFTALATFLGELSNAFIQSFIDIWNWFKWLYQSMVNIFYWLVEKWYVMVDSFKNAFSRITNAIIAPFKTAFNWVARAWNLTIGKLRFTVPSWVPEFGGRGWSMPLMPTLLADGGIVTKPTFAMVGEGSEPEAVIPLSKLDKMLNGGAGSGVTNNIGTINISKEVDGERWLQKLSRQTNITGYGMVGQTNV